MPVSTSSKKTAPGAGARRPRGEEEAQVSLPDESTLAPALPTTPATYGLKVSRILREEIIPSVSQHGMVRVVLARPHLAQKDVPKDFKFSSRGALGRAVRRRGHITNTVTHFPDDGMEALRFPCLCFIYKGEADIPAGDAMLHCPSGTVIVVPPGVALTAGRDPHWARPHLEDASSDILWLHLLPFGAQFHLCHTRGHQHESEYHRQQHVVAHRQLFTIAEQLIEEMEMRREYSDEVAAAHLLTLLYLLDRHGSQPAAMRALVESPPLFNRDMNDPAVVLARAQEFIEENLGRPLSLASIARASYVSRARLTQLFRDKLKKSVWGYVTERRLKEAKMMLGETNIYVHDIARLCGFSHQSHFFARFAESEGATPGEFRKRAKKRAARKKS